MYLFHVVLFIVALKILYNKETRIQCFSVLKRPNTLLLIFAWFWLFISLFWAENKIYGLTYMIQLSLGLSLFILIQVLIQNEKDFTFYKLKILAPVLGVIVVVSILEIYTNFRWPISLLSYNNHWFGRENLVVELLQKELISGYLLSSPTAFFWNPNNLAVVLCFFIPFFFEKRWTNYVIFSVLVIIIIQTGSRITMISLLLGLFVALLFNPRHFRFLMLYTSILMLPLVLLSETTFAYKCNEIVEKISGQSLLYKICVACPEPLQLPEGDNSQQIRSQLYRQGLSYLKESNFLGVGAGNAEWHNFKQKVNTQNITAVHFYWFELVINGGILIALIFFAYFFRIFKTLWLKRKNRLAQSLFIALFIFSISVISLSSAHYFLPYYAFLGMLTAATEILNLHEKNSSAH